MDVKDLSPFMNASGGYLLFCVKCALTGANYVEQASFVQDGQSVCASHLEGR